MAADEFGTIPECGSTGHDTEAAMTYVNAAANSRGNPYRIKNRFVSPAIVRSNFSISMLLIKGRIQAGFRASPRQRANPVCTRPT